MPGETSAAASKISSAVRREDVLCAEDAAGGQAEVGADDVGPGGGHGAGLGGVKDVGDGEQAAVVGEAYGLDLALIARALGLEGGAEAPVYHAGGGVVDDSGEAHALYLADVVVHGAGGVGGVEAEEERDPGAGAHELAQGVVHDEVVAVGVAEEAGHGAAAHLPVFAGAEGEDEVAAPGDGVFCGDAAARGDSDEMPVPLDPAAQEAEGFGIVHHGPSPLSKRLYRSGAKLSTRYLQRGGFWI